MRTKQWIVWKDVHFSGGASVRNVDSYTNILYGLSVCEALEFVLVYFLASFPGHS